MLLCAEQFWQVFLILPIKFDNDNTLRFIFSPVVDRENE